jgi:hypothetical protein
LQQEKQEERGAPSLTDNNREDNEGESDEINFGHTFLPRTLSDLDGWAQLLKVPPTDWDSLNDMPLRAGRVRD